MVYSTPTLDACIPLSRVKPGLKNFSVAGVIVEFIDDPPQSATDLRNVRYFYKFADGSGSIQLAVPHGVLYDHIAKSKRLASLNRNGDIALAEWVLFPQHCVKPQEQSIDVVINTCPVDAPFSGGNRQRRYVGSAFAEDSDWSGWSTDENEESLKWLLQPGDVVFIQAACTTWSYGQLVLVPTEKCTQPIAKIDKFTIDFKLEPDYSRAFTTKHKH